jgi:putative zinc finger/helix-turn-helix YgiT family protein
MDIQQVISDPCPTCERTGGIEYLTREEQVKVKGEEFAVAAGYFHCRSCDTTFEAAGGTDSLALAYSKYRGKHGMVTPEQLRAWRLRLELKQSELATLMGWSTATVSRYENGALQDDAHDRAMKAAMTPEGLLALVDAADGLSEVVRQRLRAKANAAVGGAPSLLRVLTSRFAAVAGEVQFDLKKTTELVLYFCHGAKVPRTKLNKLLWYVDFLHAKHFGRAVTGMPYVRLQYGPVPESYELLFMAMQSDEVLEIQTEEFDDGWTAHYHVARRTPDLTAFSATELQALARVQAEFEKMTAKAIADRSHEEDAWKRTAMGAVVSVEHASTLTLSL